MSGYNHDHDEELGMYWYDASGAPLAEAPPLRPPDAALPLRPRAAPQRRRPRDEAYWDETFRLVLDYFDLKAGPNASEAVAEGFIPWLLQSRARVTEFADGDDMRRAQFVDRYLNIAR